MVGGICSRFSDMLPGGSLSYDNQLRLHAAVSSLLCGHGTGGSGVFYISGDPW